VGSRRPPASDHDLACSTKDGSVYATRGDLRERAQPVRDARGDLLVFPDESAACEWAWIELQSDLSSAGTVYTDEQAQRARATAEKVQHRMAERLQQWEENRGGAR
jgi:hypothetical protein